MTNKYVIENLTLKKLSYLFYIIRFNIIFEYITLEEFLNQGSDYLEVISKNNRHLHMLSLYVEDDIEKLRINSGYQTQDPYGFSIAFPLEDLKLCFIDKTKEIYLEEKSKYNERNVHIPIYYDTDIEEKKINMDNFVKFIKLLADYIVTKEEEA